MWTNFYVELLHNHKKIPQIELKNRYGRLINHNYLTMIFTNFSSTFHQSVTSVHLMRIMYIYPFNFNKVVSLFWTSVCLCEVWS